VPSKKGSYCVGNTDCLLCCRARVRNGLMSAYCASSEVRVRCALLLRSCCWLLNLCSSECNQVSGTGWCMFSGRFITVWSERGMCDRSRFLSWRRLPRVHPCCMAEPVHQTDVEMLIVNDDHEATVLVNRGALESVGGTLFEIFSGRQSYEAHSRCMMFKTAWENLKLHRRKDCKRAWEWLWLVSILGAGRSFLTLRIRVMVERTVMMWMKKHMIWCQSSAYSRVKPSSMNITAAVRCTGVRMSCKPVMSPWDSIDGSFVILRARNMYPTNARLYDGVCTTCVVCEIRWNLLWSSWSWVTMTRVIRPCLFRKLLKSTVFSNMSLCVKEAREFWGFGSSWVECEAGSWLVLNLLGTVARSGYKVRP